MRLKDAIASLQQEHPEDALIPLYTPWGEALDPEHVWEEYPRPQLKREHYHMLNGWWEYAIVPDTEASPARSHDDSRKKEAPPSDASKNHQCITPGLAFLGDGRILVPFSPESLLSGAGRQLLPGERLWYQRTLSFSDTEIAWKEMLNRRCLLQFGAADQQAWVYVDGIPVAYHCGGYLPFTADITDFVDGNPHLLQVKIQDDSDSAFYTRGKQTLKRGGMYYTAQSGIWQSVWYEWVPENAVFSLWLTPDPDKGQIRVELFSARAFSRLHCQVGRPTAALDEKKTPADGAVLPCKAETISVTPVPDFADKNAAAGNASSCVCTTLVITLPEPLFLWSPESPGLYPLTVTADEDRVESYFALRCFCVEPDEKGILRFCLNHKPYFLHGLLDQGYWSDGLMTAPSDEAFLYDIRLAKDFGFNMLRKHIKIEPLRWYYHCDRLGMIVWQDMVSGGSTYHLPLVCYLPTLFPHMTMHTRDNHYRLFSRSDAQSRKDWEQECLDTMEHLYNVPSLAVWVPFNEGWGQFDAARIAQLVKEKDPTRPVDHASGWFDQKGGDFRSIHNYFRPLKVKPDRERAFVISEYGGYACHIPGHSSVERIYGYKQFDTPDVMSTALEELFTGQLFPLEAQGLSGAVYTQLSDVEEEVNGLVTYDRRVVKYRPGKTPSS